MLSSTVIPSSLGSWAAFLALRKTTTTNIHPDIMEYYSIIKNGKLESSKYHLASFRWKNQHINKEQNERFIISREINILQMER